MEANCFKMIILKKNLGDKICFYWVQILLGANMSGKGAFFMFGGIC